MKKIRLVVLIIFTLAVAGCIVYVLNPTIRHKVGRKPKIVTGELCSDLCNGTDIKRYYEGVSDSKMCKDIGGTPYTYYGWGEFTACLAE
jgi:hypothetical protein